MVAGSSPGPVQLHLVANLFDVHQASMVSLVQGGPHGTVHSAGRDGTVVHYRWRPPDCLPASSCQEGAESAKRSEMPLTRLSPPCICVDIRIVWWAWVGLTVVITFRSLATCVF